MEAVAIKAGICEDDPVQQKNLTRMLESWSESRSVKLRLFVYDSSSALWFDWCARMDFDLLILDIDLGKERENGMELARRIRQRDGSVSILFVTGLPEYMNQGYDVQALHFLVKPVEKERMYAVLDRALSAAKGPEESLLLEEETRVQKILLHRILYLEAFSHSVTLHLAGEECLEVKRGMKEMEQQLPADGFFRCHRSYLIHLLHVRKIAGNQVFLEGGAVLPVSRMKEKKLYQAFLEYHRSSCYGGD